MLIRSSGLLLLLMIQLGNACTINEECDIYAPVCIDNQCRGCNADQDCRSKSLTFNRCDGTNGHCFSTVPEKTQYQPGQIIVTAVLFIINGGVSVILILACVFTQRVPSFSSTKVDSTEMESATN